MHDEINILKSIKHDIMYLTSHTNNIKTKLILQFVYTHYGLK